MEKKYLQFIDILGFKELVEDSTLKVRRLYNIIESLNVHSHEAFNVIVFSDTILIYNNFTPLHAHDHSYIVMFQIEFAQNLLYELIGKGYYFRSTLVYGEFEHVTRNNFEQYFGKGLISAYTLEKEIQCTGIFIDNHCLSKNNISPTERYNKELSFVYVTQSYDRFNSGELGDIPVSAYWLNELDSQWGLAKEVRYFQDIYHEMRNNPSPKIRGKYLAT